MTDIALIETGNGGDIQLMGNDLVMVNAENNPYLGMFGGNLEQDTENEITQAQSFDYWANNLLMPNNPSIWFNSDTERTMINTPLTSAGRLIIENAIKSDLEFMSDFAEVTVQVVITATDRIQVNITVKQNDSSQRIIIVNYKKTTDGDFVITDFNDDFFL